MSCWVCLSKKHEANKCSFLCKDCEGKLPGSVGKEGKDCKCPDRDAKDFEARKKEYGETVALAQDKILNSSMSAEERRKAITDLVRAVTD